MKRLVNFKFSKLFFAKQRISGRNNSGRITVRHRGGGSRFHSPILFSNYGVSEPFVVFAQNLHQGTHWAMSSNGSLMQFLAPKQLLLDNCVGGFGPFGLTFPGSGSYLRFFPQGSRIYNVSFKPFAEAPRRFSFSAASKAPGTFSQLLVKDQNHCILRLPSGQFKTFSDLSVGQFGSVFSKFEKPVNYFLKAGYNRWFGRKPAVRGEAMNPVDHPHGGKTRGGRHPVSFNSLPTKGYRTRRKKLN